MGTRKFQDILLTEIMTTKFQHVDGNTIMTEVAKIFDDAGFHHLPVLNEASQPLGVISRLDYHQLQHHFTRFGWQNPESHNDYLFSTLLAREVMTKPAVTLDEKATIGDAVAIFLKNQVHSILIVQEGRCVGILTTFDILKVLDRF